MRDPKDQLVAGRELLDPVLLPHGFTFKLERTGVGSGGAFASGNYSRNDRRLELHFRSSLGLVTYHVASASLGHESYMRLLGVRDKCSYPDFSQSSLDSFRNLASDIERFCSDFLAGDGEEFQRLSASANLLTNGISRIP
jgi:hypothetical protein